MRIKYNKTTWVDNETPVNADNMNKIETALENLYKLALSPSDFSTNSQIKPVITDESISLDFNGFVLREVSKRPLSWNSKGTPGDFYIDSERVNLVYICFRPDRWLCINCFNFDNINTDNTDNNNTSNTNTNTNTGDDNTGGNTDDGNTDLDR